MHQLGMRVRHIIPWWRILVTAYLSPLRRYGFSFATTLSAAHYCVCALSIWATQGLGSMKSVALPFRGGEHCQFIDFYIDFWGRPCRQQQGLLADLSLFTQVTNASICSLS